MIRINGGVGLLRALAVAIVMASPAAAQTTDFSALVDRVRPGDTVTVVSEDGMETQGLVAAVQPRWLTVIAGGVERAWPEVELREVRRRGDPVKDGLLVGTLAGAAVGALGGWLVSPRFVNEGRSATERWRRSRRSALPPGRCWASPSIGPIRVRRSSSGGRRRR